MRSVFAFVVWLSVCGTALANPIVSGSDQGAIQGVISRQIEAFRHDDAAKAFSFAAPALQGMFATPGRFMAMVRQGYGPLYRPRTIEFGQIAARDGEIVQPVEVIGPDGGAYTALYTMQRQSDGSWRISACELLESARVGT